VPRRPHPRPRLRLRPGRGWVRAACPLAVVARRARAHSRPSCSPSASCRLPGLPHRPRERRQCRRLRSVGSRPSQLLPKPPSRGAHEAARRRPQPRAAPRPLQRRAPAPSSRRRSKVPRSNQQPSSQPRSNLRQSSLRLSNLRRSSLRRSRAQPSGGAPVPASRLAEKGDRSRIQARRRASSAAFSFRGRAAGGVLRP